MNPLFQSPRLSDVIADNSLVPWDLVRYDSETYGAGTCLLVKEINRKTGFITGYGRTTDQKAEMFERMVPFSNESARVARPNISETKQSNVDANRLQYLVNNRIFGEIATYLRANNSPEVLRDLFYPKHFVNVGNRGFGIPSQAEYGQLFSYFRFPLWSIDASGKAEVRYVYYSNSDQRFRVSPGIEPDRLIKGDNFGLSYVTSNRLYYEIENLANEIFAKSSPKYGSMKYSVAPNMLVDPENRFDFSKWPTQYQDFSKETRGWFGSEVFRILGSHDLDLIPSRWWESENISARKVLGKLDSLYMFFTKWGLDFNNPNRTYEARRWNDKVKVSVFQTYLSGRIVEWHLAEPQSNALECWLDDVIVRTPNIVNSFGVPDISVETGGLVWKMEEYLSQVGNRLYSDPEAKGTLFWDKGGFRYADLRPFIYNNPIARHYRKFLQQKHRLSGARS